ncbi:MAG: MotA/TolQ/ExbB proton channel family protein [Clostridium sp.]|nr:MotA/TolQ/ExbB proton channel family protein [Prevotella sp.]MCM1428548.1 MotA/TolQ/ExbB proton channel family protein [Clostridium sp.]MCM1475012.1 MotA/TolQ/ExbB proton channel family protein [Muribaculaceae bacterium]
MNIWQLVIDGGYIMIPLAILLLISIYIFTERCIVINRALKGDPSFMKRIRDYIFEGDLESAVNLCRRSDSPASRMILKGISRVGRPTQDVLTAVENAGNLEIANLGKGMTWLSTTAAGAPMLGFLGTVVGMIQAFYNLSLAGSAANVTHLSGGIYQALVTTVAGLIVGIVALFAYNYLSGRLNRVANSLEAKTMEFMDLLNEPSR